MVGEVQRECLDFSVFYGRYAVELLDVRVGKKWPKEWWHRRVNFVGSAVGWVAAYYFVAYRLTVRSDDRSMDFAGAGLIGGGGATRAGFRSKY